MIEAIILAAGSSQRMGKENKLLKSYNDETIISHVVQQVIASQVDKVIVVTGHDDEAIRRACEFQSLSIIHNPDHLNGQIWSIRTGLDQISDDAQGIMILLGDMPLITPRHINNVISHYRSMRKHHDCVITRPFRQGSIGHPIIWDSKLKSAIVDYQEDEHLKKLIQHHQSSYFPVHVDDDGYYIDVDTPEDYHDLVAQE